MRYCKYGFVSAYTKEGSSGTRSIPYCITVCYLLTFALIRIMSQSLSSINEKEDCLWQKNAQTGAIIIRHERTS